MAELSESQRRTLRQRIDEREAELQAQVRDARGELAARPGAGEPDVADLGEAGEQRLRHGMEHAALQRDQEELRALDDARERLTHGRYGDCADCSRPIPFERLRVQPTAERCIDCQTRWEKTHPTTPGFTV